MDNLINKTTEDIYEASYYLLYGAGVDQIKIRRVAENKIDKKGYRKQCQIYLSNVPNWAVDSWGQTKVFGPITDYIQARKRLKKLINRFIRER